MKCPRCNEEMPDDVLFCPNCGARVSDTLPPSSAGAPTFRINTRDEPRRITTELADDAQPSASSPYGLPQAPLTPQVVPQGRMPAAVMPDTVPTNTTAIVSLVFGILGWTFLPFIGAIVAIVAGHMARREINRAEGQVSGKGLATAGLVLGYLQVGLAVLGCLVFVIFVTVLGVSYPS